MNTLHYLKYSKILKNICKKWTRSSGISFDELMGEANLVYTVCMKNYDPLKGAFHAYLHSSVWRQIKKYTSKSKPIEVPEEMNHRFQRVSYTSPEDNAVFQNVLETLSADATLIVDAIFNAEDELLDMFKQVGRMTRGVLRTYFRKNKWSHYRIDNAFHEIKGIL